MIFSLVFWIGVNGLIGYAIGKSKNSISACVLLSLLFGPIGWLIALGVKGNLRKCPFCAEQIKPEAKVCRYCGREVTPTRALPVNGATIKEGWFLALTKATAEVLSKHQFNPRVTPGSADKGIDIEVTRNGLKGVVQCKAHGACVGPHVVRDLYGVIHHCGASFGIIVSRGGFARGAIEFARDKPILFLDTDDLIAMQEGRDVLANAFSRKNS